MEFKPSINSCLRSRGEGGRKGRGKVTLEISGSDNMSTTFLFKDLFVYIPIIFQVGHVCLSDHEATMCVMHSNPDFYSPSPRDKTYLSVQSGEDQTSHRISSSIKLTLSGEAQGTSRKLHENARYCVYFPIDQCGHALPAWP